VTEFYINLGPEADWVVGGVLAAGMIAYRFFKVPKKTSQTMQFGAFASVLVGVWDLYAGSMALPFFVLVGCTACGIVILSRSKPADSPLTLLRETKHAVKRLGILSVAVINSWS